MRGLRLPLMILRTPRDAVAGIDNATVLFEAARHPKSFVSLGDADHLLTDRADARFAAGVIAAWAGRGVAAPEAAGERPRPRARCGSSRRTRKASGRPCWRGRGTG